MKAYPYIIFLLMGALAAGCSKDKLMSFSLTPKVYVYKASNNAQRDSATYSFAIKTEETMVDTFRIPIRVMGGAVAADRTVSYEATTDASADKTAYELLPAVIKAGSFDGSIPVKLNKTASLKTKEIRLWIKITDSKDLQAGVTDQLSYLLKINNFLSKPASWNETYFGKYSQVKYGLIIRETGYTAFSGLRPSETTFIMQKSKNAVLEYEQQHGTPLLDEFGEAVTFPR